MNSWLSPELEGYLAPQERFEGIRRAALLAKGTRLCDLSYANAYDGPAPGVVDAIRRALDTDRALDLQYTPYGGSTVTRRLVAEQISRHTAMRQHWRDIVMTPGAMAGLKMVFRAVQTGRTDDEIAVVTPCWLDYPLYIAALGLRPVFVPAGPDGRVDLDRLAAALSPRTRAVVLTQPGNPTGVIHSREDLAAMATVLRAAPAPPLLVSDECHRDTCDAGVICPSPVEAYADTVTIYSFGKSLFMQGQRIGYAAVSPQMTGGRAFSTHLERVCRMMGFCTPTSLMQLAVRAMLDLRPDLTAIAARRTRVVAALQQAGYDLIPPQATFFVYARALDPDDFAFVERLAGLGLLTLPARLFHDRGHFRLSLTAPDAMVDGAIDVLRLAAAGAAA